MGKIGLITDISTTFVGLTADKLILHEDLMDELARIKEPLKDDFLRYEEYMKEALRSDSPYVEGIMDYIISNRGKGIRPMLVMLLAHIHGKAPLNGRAYVAAMLVEMIHNASLIHDDVVDDAAVRHGKPSVNSRWNNRISVLSGDYILARSFASGLQSREFDLVSYIAGCVSELAEGELIQNDVNSRRRMTRETYLDVIFKKTATLLGISSGAGATAAGASEEEVAIAYEIGINLGMAFQIKDDILDYSPSEQTGKPYCADLREKKVTLPLITILERSDDLTKKLILSKFECIDTDPEQIGHISGFVIKEGGLAAAEEVMHGYLDKARASIGVYPESEYKASLLSLCDFIGVREH